MRDAFAKELTTLAEGDDRIVLLSGDIGNRLFDDFKSRFPTRFLNCGVAEANMIGVAGGLALSGLKPIAYTIASFVTTRCFEQIRVDLCYHKVPGIVVGVGAGLSYAANGATHHSCEDIAILRALPDMTILCPGDAWEVRAALRAAIKHDGPVYLRLGKKGEALVHQSLPDLTIGKSILLREGKDVCMLSTGNVLPLAVEAADRLKTAGVRAQLVSFPCVKPLDEETLKDVFSKFKVVVTVEEHSLVGGLGGAIAEWLVDRPPLRARLLRFGTADAFLHEAGGQEHARGQYGLTVDGIAQRTRNFLQSEALALA